MAHWEYFHLCNIMVEYWFNITHQRKDRDELEVSLTTHSTSSQNREILDAWNEWKLYYSVLFTNEYYFGKMLLLWQELPYHDDSITSQLLRKVHHCRSQLVLRWEITLESWVLFILLPNIPWGKHHRVWKYSVKLTTGTHRFDILR